MTRQLFHRVGVLLILLLMGGTEPVYAQVRGRVEGQVLDARTRAPIPEATVQVERSIVAAAVDEQGRFQLGVPAGRRVLVARAPGYCAKQEHVDVEAAGLVQVKIKLRPLKVCQHSPKSLGSTLER